MQHIKICFFLFSFFFIISSCKQDRLNIPTPKPLENIHFYRLDLDLSNCKNEYDFEQLNANYLKNISDLYTYYTVACIRVGYPKDSITPYNLALFAHDTYMQKVTTALQNNFSGNPKETEINQAFGYLNHYFPEGKLPVNIVYYNSAFTNSVLSSPTSIGVGLERYLGQKNELIEQLSGQVFFDYIKAKMDASFMVRDLVFSWVNTNYFEPDNENKVLIERAINSGKIYYITEACLPKSSKAILMRYNEEEYTWAEKNEGDFWRYLVEKNAFFKHDQKIATNIFNDGPFTPGLPVEEKSPARLGHYLGWKIVKAYMDEHPEVSISKLISVDYKEVLKSYKTND
jgi:hypothetical protein